MATTLGTIRTNVRTNYLNETTASLWTDAELLVLILNGVKDLRRKIIGVNGDYFQTVDATNVSLAANTATLTGVPTDVARIQLIQPRDTTDASTTRFLKFFPRRYNSLDFRQALAQSALDPTGGYRIFYARSGAGAPVAAPTVYVAPQITAAVTLRLVYIPTFGSLTASSDNPIPGDSDAALEAYCTAYALGKEVDTETGTVRPDPFWLGVYKEQCDGILAVLDPPQEQEPKVVAGPFDDEQDDFY